MSEPSSSSSSSSHTLQRYPVRNLPGSYVSGQRGRPAAYDDPSVARTIARLRTNLANLEDLSKGSLLKNDYYQYCVKPSIQAVVDSDSDLRALHSGGSQDKNGRVYGHPNYTWFLNACATRCVDNFIKNNFNSIFGNGKLSEKVTAAMLDHDNGDNGLGYCKRQFSNYIKRYYVSHRLQLMDDMTSVDWSDIKKIRGVMDDYNRAMTAKRQGLKVGEYNNRMKYGAPLSSISSHTAPPPPSRTTITSPPSMSSSSSSSSASFPPYPGSSFTA